jgi:metal-sulfur cluster biosynthetic enzyme
MLDNANPVVVHVDRTSRRPRPAIDADGNLDLLAIFDLIRDIEDPEHPYSLEQLSVVKPELISGSVEGIEIEFVPTVPTCSLSTLIGLLIRIQLMRNLPRNIKTSIRVQAGSHMQEKEINKQLADKERVAAALENPVLLDLVNSKLAG